MRRDQAWQEARTIPRTILIKKDLLSGSPARELASILKLGCELLGCEQKILRTTRPQSSANFTLFETNSSKKLCICPNKKERQPNGCSTRCQFFYYKPITLCSKWSWVLGLFESHNNNFYWNCQLALLLERITLGVCILCKEFEKNKYLLKKTILKVPSFGQVSFQKREDCV